MGTSSPAPADGLTAPAAAGGTGGNRRSLEPGRVQLPMDIGPFQLRRQIERHGSCGPRPRLPRSAAGTGGGRGDDTEGETPAFRLRTGWEACRSSFTQGEQFPMFLNFVPDMGLTSGGLWYDGPQGSGLRSRLPRRCAAGRRRFLKTREKPTGDVRPLPRARNQVREPRRRRHAPARRGAGAGYARKRDPLPVGEGETMTATDPQPAAMLSGGG